MGEREVQEAHDRAVAAGEPGYLDPVSGAFVFTADALEAQGTCCGSARTASPTSRARIPAATPSPLMAAAEGWPATPWMQPWEPAQ